MTNLYIRAQQEWGNYCKSFNADLVVTLNTQRDNPTYDSLSKLISSLFYELECIEYGKNKRDLYGKVCRIERIVAIEEANKTHAHVLIRQYGSKTSEEIIESIVLVWHELNKTKVVSSNSYLVSLEDYVIRDNDAVSTYVTKDVAKQLQKGKDVIDLKSSSRIQLRSA